MKKIILLSLLVLPYSLVAQSNGSTPLPWSQRMAASMLTTNPDSIAYPRAKMARWEYEMGVLLRSYELLWYRTGDARYINYIQKNMDRFVNADGTIRTYDLDHFNIDYVTPGRSLLLLYQQTLPNKEKYRKAADLLRKQLAEQPRTKEGGFWHKKIYPNQMWLDGLYMAEPFYAEYTRLFSRDGKDFNDIINQFVWMEQHAHDPKTGLLYHGWDESREQKWADPKTGKSPNFWSRSIGWYVMALVDVLDYIPADQPRRGELVAILQRLMPAVVNYQDPKEGCWYQVTDRGGDKGNYMEASGTAMFVYGLAKGVRLGYLPASMMTYAKKGYTGMLKNFISTDEAGLIHLEKTVSVSGLGGNPYRSGSYDYYLSEPLRKDDLKGVGPFIMASVEMETAEEAGLGKGKTVGVDTYFNHEFRKGITGEQEPFHYTWEDRQHSGFWLWGNTFRDLGAKTVSVSSAPTAASLKGVDVYIIVDPDTPKETAKPNYVSQADSKAISDWVKAGGVLVLMSNDTSNCEHLHFNQLAAQFGLQFLPKNVNMVKGDQFEQGSVKISAGNPIFSHTKEVYIKELSPLSVKAPAKSVVSAGDNVIIAVANVGKGTVFAVGDPWLYNEYTDGRKIPARYENFSAGKDLATWLLKQAK
ncbi:glycoside hydrolase family 88/105 protein [Spirosoma endbachense]|uniref:Glycoside hydrolase family 88 protein n=1 Tax=Spirosoma endbachense TaxID=2666025 RepID=A0A6P1W784_9BACT|nr:glycoside hydrolase family 88 protein [Spirosoma endbachense]QHV99897.1 glycoside hydrolase family 88 protein [Spirosoma endbachense]